MHNTLHSTKKTLTFVSVFIYFASFQVFPNSTFTINGTLKFTTLSIQVLSRCHKDLANMINSSNQTQCLFQY